jgi:hypothetical protein
MQNEALKSDVQINTSNVLMKEQCLLHTCALLRNDCLKLGAVCFDQCRFHQQPNLPSAN